MMTAIILKYNVLYIPIKLFVIIIIITYDRENNVPTFTLHEESTLVGTLPWTLYSPTICFSVPA